jgi:hypothetical protein
MPVINMDIAIIIETVPSNNLVAGRIPALGFQSYNVVQPICGLLQTDQRRATLMMWSSIIKQTNDFSA